VAAQYAFGATGATIMGILLALLLISTVSAMIVAGPRVLHAIGQDFPAFKELAVANSDGVPARAILLQCVRASSCRARYSTVPAFSWDAAVNDKLSAAQTRLID